MADKSTKPAPDADAQREQFLAALEAKKHKGGHAATSPEAGGGAVKDHSSRSGGKREFRRKSGG
jgi:hypothetical protein